MRAEQNEHGGTPATAGLRVSVIIPVLNGEAYLGEALASVRAQQGHAVEIIVVDDGSTDGSLDIARQTADVVLTTTGRQGPSFARNLGATHARQDLVAFLDADDRWLPHHLDTAARAFTNAPDATLFFAQVRAFGTDNYTTNAGRDVPPFTAFDARVALLERNIVTQITVVVKRTAFAALGGYNESLRYAEDYDLWHRLAWAGTFVHAPEVTAEYRVHPAQATSQLLRLLRGSWDVRLKHFVRLCARDRQLAERAATLLAKSWTDETQGTIRSGRADLFAMYAERHAELAEVLRANGFPVPVDIAWSASTAQWFRLRRWVKSRLHSL
ncbi:MAG: glycosyltransferase [Gemmatimonadota bacterium]